MILIKRRDYHDIRYASDRVSYNLYVYFYVFLRFSVPRLIPRLRSI